jgi:hypothetical protein
MIPSDSQYRVEPVGDALELTCAACPCDDNLVASWESGASFGVIAATVLEHSTKHLVHGLDIPKAFVLVCRDCADAEIPFPSSAERGRWASAHTEATGHMSFRVFES